MDSEILEKFNMTKVEAVIFSELIKLGDSKIGKLIRGTGLHRGTVYNSLQRLCEKGFVSYYDREDSRYYTPSGVEIFKHMLKEEEEDIIKGRKIIGDVEEAIKLSKNIEKGTDKPKVTVRIGEKGFKSIMNEMMDWSEKTKQRYLFMGKGGEIKNYIGTPYFKKLQREKKKRKIKARLIINENVNNKRSTRDFDADIRYMPYGHLSQFSSWIYGDNVIIVPWHSKPIISIIIKSKEVSEAYKNIFDRIWNSPTYFISREEFEKKYIRLLNENQTEIKIIAAHNTAPFVLYPRTKRIFGKLREAVTKKREVYYRSFADELWEGYNRQLGKRKFKIVMSEEGFYTLFDVMNKEMGKTWMKKHINILKQDISKGRFGIMINNDRTGLTSYMDDEGVLQALIVQDDVFGAFTSQEENIVKSYNKLFQKLWDRGTDISVYLDKYLKKIEKK